VRNQLKGYCYNSRRACVEHVDIISVVCCKLRYFAYLIYIVSSDCVLIALNVTKVVS